VRFRRLRFEALQRELRLGAPPGPQGCLDAVRECDLRQRRVAQRIEAIEGELATLEEQDRSLWDRAAIEEACALLERAMRMRRPGPYQLQAAIAACHATAESADETDWAEIVILYDRLNQLVATPAVALNRAVAVAMAFGPQAGLDLVEELEADRELADYYLLPATRADLLRRLGHGAEARSAYEQALELAPTDAERRYLSKRLAEAPI
jgi:RNA polymerase sigma-70 factor, ECF subfamily